MIGFVMLDIRSMKIKWRVNVTKSTGTESKVKDVACWKDKKIMLPLPRMRGREDCMRPAARGRGRVISADGRAGWRAARPAPSPPAPPRPTPAQVHTVQYTVHTVQYSTVQYSTVQYSTVQDSTVQYKQLNVLSWYSMREVRLIIERKRLICRYFIQDRRSHRNICKVIKTLGERHYNLQTEKINKDVSCLSAYI